MAITQAMPTSFKLELLQGYHAFRTPPVRASSITDIFKMALYTSSATLGAATTVYSTSGEVPDGGGYSAGGETLVLYGATIGGTTAYTGFLDLTWAAASFTANGGLIYNSSQGNRAVAVLAFGSDKTATSGNFTIRFPVYDDSNAIIRIV